MADLVAELRLFVMDVGVGHALVVFLAAGTFALLWTGYRDWRRQRSEAAIIRAKEQEIARLAEENRIWRDYFFRKEGGLSLAEIEKLGHADPAVPLEPGFRRRSGGK